jgi:hypothetical protein
MKEFFVSGPAVEQPDPVITAGIVATRRSSDRFPDS